MSQKKILFGNVAVFLLRGVWAVKIWKFWGAEHIYALTWWLAHIPYWTPFFPLYTSEWLFDPSYFPREYFFWDWDTLYVFWCFATLAELLIFSSFTCTIQRKGYQKHNTKIFFNSLQWVVVLFRLSSWYSNANNNNAGVINFHLTFNIVRLQTFWCTTVD